jgi:N-acetylglucosaminyldiphosphoundecaprenol N-acetyl-beta-D-mannosaminyltransferase
MDYIDELVLDAEYVRSLSLRRDASVLFRAVPGLITWLLFGNEPAEYPPTVNILGIRVDNLPMQAAIDRIAQMLASSQASHVCFINPHNINQSFVVPEYKQALERADLILADGFGTKLAGKILHRPLRQNLCGTDLFPRLCKQLADTEKTMYLLGALPGGAERTADWVREHYPNVVIKGCHHGYFSPEEEPDVVRDIAESGADILVISMGVPTQELWADRHLKDLNVKVAMGFGGLFDYFSGRIPRAPRWVREIGMEWVYRLIQEPRRMWRRYLIGNFVFLARVLRERICGTGETSSNATTG